MDQELLDLLARVGDTTNPLTDDELGRLRTALRETAATVDPAAATAEDIELLSEAADNLNRVQEEIDLRETAAAERAAEAQALLEQINPPAPAADPEPVVAEADPAAEPVAVDAPAEPEPVVEPEPVAASGATFTPEPVATPARRQLPSMAHLARSRPHRAAPIPTATDGARSGRAVLVAAADIPGLAAGASVDPDDLRSWADSCMRRQAALRVQPMPAGQAEKVYFGSINVDFPEDRLLDKNELGNMEKISAVVGEQALVASGGVCAPVAVDYSLTAIAVADRPVQGAMANFGATRGGLRYVLPHTLAAVTADGPCSIWTEATDAAPGASVKPHATFVCQGVLENYVDAITSIVQFGNFQARYFPEQITEYMDTVDAVHARVAESNLLAQVSAGSTATIADTYELGAARDFVATIDRAAAAYRYRNRMRRTTPLRLICPEWIQDMVKADLARQLPGDSNSAWDRLSTSEAQIGEYLSSRNVNVTWSMEAQTNAATTGAAALTWIPIQGAGQLAPWPVETQCWLYHEGAWMFLDGGELNLGMVRDSTLNRTNDFQMFSESFEKAILRGHESVQMTVKIAPTGASAGTVSPPENIGS